ncbi:MAG: hypothetical protein Q8P56_04440 [Candidatus Uhrbacteria bacterium]|nr:hypothetical protein [Candidatus Uhrbacteria bacterium]
MHGEEHAPSLIDRLIELKSEHLAYTSMSNDPEFQANEECLDRIERLEKDIAILENQLTPDECVELKEEFDNKKFQHLAGYIRKYKKWHR